MGSKSIACRAAIAAAAVSMACGGMAFANPAGVTYNVHVATSYGTQFRDCFSFDTAGTLTVAGYGPLTYLPGGRGAASGKFQAVSSVAVATSVGFALAFNGLALGNGTYGAIKGSGLNEGGTGFSYHGYPDAGCTAASRSVSPYRTP